MITTDEKKAIQKAAYDRTSNTVKPSKTAASQIEKRRIV